MRNSRRLIVSNPSEIMSFTSAPALSEKNLAPASANSRPTVKLSLPGLVIEIYRKTVHLRFTLGSVHVQCLLVMLSPMGLFQEKLMNVRPNMKSVFIAIVLAVGLGASSASNADSYRWPDRYYDSPKSGLSLYFGYGNRGVDRYRYGYSSGQRYDNRYYDDRYYNNRAYSNRFYDNRSYRSNSYCPGYGIIYYDRPGRNCYRHADHYHCG